MCGENNNFQDFINGVKPIRFREPLAETLGAFKNEDEVLDYTCVDVIKMAGHVCPTVAGAYICCQKAVEKLYLDKTPVRGEISIVVYGEPDEGAYGVMAQVFCFLTGSAPETGFKGLGPKFKRKDLLKFSSEKIDPESMCFKFKRIDNNNSIMVKFSPWKIPFPKEHEKKIGELLEAVIWEAANKEERKEFQSLWLEKVKTILAETQIEKWLKLEKMEK